MVVLGEKLESESIKPPKSLHVGSVILRFHLLKELY